MILIDANALVVLLLGFMNPSLINTHKRPSIYEKQDFDDLVFVIEKFENLLVLPNVWTEVDNLLNNFTGNRRYLYIEKLTETLKLVSERYIPTLHAIDDLAFIDLGVTDTLLLQVAKQCQLLITADSVLSDYAIANNILVYDMVKNRNSRFA